MKRPKNMVTTKSFAVTKIEQDQYYELLQFARNKCLFDITGSQLFRKILQFAIKHKIELLKDGMENA